MAQRRRALETSIARDIPPLVRRLEQMLLPEPLDLGLGDPTLEESLNEYIDYIRSRGARHTSIASIKREQRQWRQDASLRSIAADQPTSALPAVGAINARDRNSRRHPRDAQVASANVVS
jgi:hypothetical protein